MKRNKEPETLTRAELLTLLREQVSASGGIRRWAASRGVNPGTVSKAHRDGAELTSAQMLRAMEIVTCYQKKEKTND